MDDVFRLAQVTDIHLGPLPRLDLAHVNLKRLTGTLNWYRSRRHVHMAEVADRIVADAWMQGADHVTVTGDLCNIGLPAEHEAARRWLGTVGDAARVSAIPGNHDIYSRIGRDPGVGRWADYMAANAAGRAWSSNEDVFPWVRVYERQGFRVALIGLNSAMETPPLIAAGELGHGQAERLRHILRQTGAAGLARIVMIHHPPLPGQAKRDRALRDAERLRDILTAEGADLVIHGHNHQAMFATLDSATGPVPVVGAPSASAATSHHGEPLARSHIYEIFQAGQGFGVRLAARGLITEGGGIEDLASRPLGRAQT